MDFTLGRWLSDNVTCYDQAVTARRLGAAVLWHVQITPCNGRGFRPTRMSVWATGASLLLGLRAPVPMAARTSAGVRDGRSRAPVCDLCMLLALP